MQQLQTTLPSGAILQDRYIVDDLLGQGGFGAVYLVRDQQNTGCFWALKEVMTQDRQEKDRLFFECEMLKHLDHPALPSGQRVFEEDGRMYMLMEYIEGPNLEVLRKQQPARQFALPQVLALLEPVVEAVSYLHRQHPPLVHRDIKPANIIVSTTAGRTVLVDFGIAKEYYVDATTTAIRHCSPGYSAPEQYSSVGTDLRSDIYGLAATCYTLLTGTPPVDALQRMTKLASKGIDPLVSADILAPEVPAAAAEVLLQALDLNYDQRFATPAEFWQALHACVVSQSFPLSPMVHTRSKRTPAIGRRALAAGVATPVHTRWHTRRTGKTRILLPVVLALLLFAGIVLAAWSHSMPPSHAHQLSMPSPTRTLHSTSTIVPPAAYTVLAALYVGRLHSLLTGVTMGMTLSVQQSNQVIKGDFIEDQLPVHLPFTGVLDTSKHVLITVIEHAGPLFFEGQVRSDGNLVGNYCRVDPVGQCVGDYGIWSVGPAK